MPSYRSLYNITPPRKPDSSDLSNTKHSTSKFSTTIDTNNASDIVKLLKTRLQYAQIKLQKGMSTEDLQLIERAFFSSPRQPRRLLASEFPPIHQSSSPQSRRVRRMLLSAMSPAQNSWRKKKKIREQRKNELIEDEAAAKTILMLSSSSSYTSSSFESRHHTTTAVSSLPYYTVINNTSSVESVFSSEEMMQRLSSLYVYKHFEQQHSSDDIFDAVSNVADYEEQSRQIGQALQRKTYPKKKTYYHHLPPHLHSSSSYYKAPPPPMFGRQLSEDPFHSKPIIHENLCFSQHSKSFSSLPLSKK